MEQTTKDKTRERKRNSRTKSSFVKKQNSEPNLIVSLPKEGSEPDTNNNSVDKGLVSRRKKLFGAFSGLVVRSEASFVKNMYCTSCGLGYFFLCYTVSLSRPKFFRV